ncbi:MAG: sigma-70 family RNA polymerase sigma factor [Gemmataceae bacterium]
MLPKPLSSVLRYLHHIVAPKLEHCSDGELLHAFVARREEASFAALVRRHGALVLNVCRHVLGHEEDAEDAFQATFLVLARKAASIRDAGSLASFLHGVAFRLSLKAKRDAARRRKHERQAQAPTYQGVDELAWREVQALVEEEIERLPSKYRTPFIRCYLQGLSRAEAAQELGVKEGTIWSRLSWARNRLQERLSRRGVALSAALASLALSQQSGAAALSRLSEATVPAALLFSARRPLVDTAALRAAALAQAGMNTFVAGKSKIVVTLLLFLLATGTGGTLFQALTPRTPTEQPSTQASSPPNKGSDRVRLDQYGDPLPDGAVARLGTVRFRTSGLVYACSLSPDGKTVAASSVDKAVTIFDAETGRPLRQLQEIPDSATSLAFAPDGRTLAAGYENGSISIWNCNTAKMVRQLRASDRGPVHPVWSLAFTPDGKALISAGEDKEIRLWEAATGKEVRRFSGHQNDIRCAVLSADGKLLASAAGNAIRLWETATGKMIRRLTGHALSIRALAISADGKLLASGSKDGMIFLWERATGTIQRRYTDGKDPRMNAGRHAHALAFSPDGIILAIGCADYSLSFLDVATWSKFFQEGYDGKNSFSNEFYHDGGIQCLLFSRDGKKLVIGRDNTLVWGNVSSEKGGSSVEIYRGAVERISFLPDGQRLFTTSDDPDDRRILEWDANSGRLIRCVPGAALFARLVSFSPDGKLMVSTQFDRNLHLFDTITGKEVRKISLPFKEGSTAIHEVCFSPDGKRLAVVGPMGKWAGLLDASAGKQLWGMGATKDWTFDQALFSSDSRLLAVVGNEAIQFVDTSSDRQWPSISLPKERISFAAALSPDGRTLALPSAEWTKEANGYPGRASPGIAPGGVLKVRNITLWETIAGKKRGSFPSPCDHVHGLMFSPDGRLLAVAGDDNAVHLWDTIEGKWLRHWQGHRGEIWPLVFSRDGRRLASGSRDTTVLIWDVSRLARQPRRRAPLSRQELGDLWSSLESADSVKTYRAILTLASVPDQAVPLLAERLRFKPSADSKQLASQIAQLDSADFAERERATTELRRLGWEAEPALSKVLENKPSLETRQRVKALLDDIQKQAPPPELLRRLRGIEIMEHIGTPEARKVIASLADGTTRLAHEAQAALERMR